MLRITARCVGSASPLISTLVGNLHQCPHDDRPNDDHAYHHGEQVHLVQISVHQSASAWYQLIRERGLGRAREPDLPKPFASDVSIDQPNDVGNANAKPSLRPTLAALRCYRLTNQPLALLNTITVNHCEGGKAQ